MKRILLLLIIVGAISAGSYLTWAAKSGERPFRSALRVACEDKLVGSLKSPSSYGMVSYRESDFRIKPGEARDLAWRQMRESGRATSEGALKKLDEWMALGDQSAPYREWYAVITYDAANSYGAIIRNEVYCTFIGREISPEGLAFGVQLSQ